MPDETPKLIDWGSITTQEMLRKELDVLAGCISAMERRMDQHEDHMAAKLESAVAAGIAKLPTLSAEEREYVRLATAREARREKLHQAIIEKTLSALVWSLIVGVAVGMWVLVREYAHAHLADFLTKPPPGK